MCAHAVIEAQDLLNYGSSELTAAKYLTIAYYLPLFIYYYLLLSDLIETRNRANISENSEFCSLIHYYYRDENFPIRRFGR